MTKRYESFGNVARNINCACASYENFMTAKMHTVISWIDTVQSGTWVATFYRTVLACSSKHRTEEPKQVGWSGKASDFRLGRSRFEYGPGHRLTGLRLCSVFLGHSGECRDSSYVTSDDNASFFILCNAGKTYASNIARCLREGSQRFLLATKWITICWGIR